MSINLVSSKTRYIVLPDSEDGIIIFIRFDTIPACDGQTDINWGAVWHSWRCAFEVKRHSVTLLSQH